MSAAPRARPTTPAMTSGSPNRDEIAVLKTTTTTIATTAGDFGGYTIPIVGLFLLAATISFLAGPLED